MFNCAVNEPFNNSVFSLWTIPAMGIHTTAQRLYEAARVLKKTVGASNVARLLNESPQTLKNWETRGVSRPGAIKAQAAIGCSATWLLDGSGQMQPISPAPPPPTGSVFEALTDDEVEMLNNYRAMMDDDRNELAAEMARRADRIRAHMAKVLPNLPLVPRQANAKAANAARAVVKTAQRSLDLDKHK